MTHAMHGSNEQEQYCSGSAVISQLLITAIHLFYFYFTLNKVMNVYNSKE